MELKNSKIILRISYKCSKNGWINTELFFEWLSHFEKYAKPTATNPILLVLDNHASHISIFAYDFCEEKNIHMVSFPPHTSDHLQPLDLTFFSSLKNALYREYDFYLSTTGHKKITESDVAELLNKALMKVATMEKAVSGFRTSVIFPFDPDKFNEDDFAPANQVRQLTKEDASEPETPTTPRPNPDNEDALPVLNQTPQLVKNLGRHLKITLSLVWLQYQRKRLI